MSILLLLVAAVGCTSTADDVRSVRAAELAAARDPEAALEFARLVRTEGVAIVDDATVNSMFGRNLLGVTLVGITQEFPRGRHWIDAPVQPDGAEPVPLGELRALMRFVFAQGLLDAGEREAALAEFVTATYELSTYDVHNPRAELHRTLGFLHQAEALAAMGRYAAAEEALAAVEPGVAHVEERPAAAALHANLRSALQRERTRWGSLTALRRPVPRPAKGMRLDFAQLQGLQRDATNAGTFVLEDADVRIFVNDEGVDFTIGDGAEVKPVGLSFASEEWHEGLGCLQWSAVGKARQVLRLWPDGVVSFGLPGVTTVGIVLSPSQPPYVGTCHLGRPVAERFVVADVVSRTEVDGPRLADSGPRLAASVRLQGGGVCVGEGFLVADRFVPDGPVTLDVPGVGTYTTTCAMGEPGDWQRLELGGMDAPVGRLVDVLGATAWYVPPSRTPAILTHLRDEQQREAAERERVKVAEEIERRRVSEAAQEALQQFAAWERERAASSRTVCTSCDGTGSRYQAGGAQQYSYGVQDRPGDPLRMVLGVRHTSGEMVPCRHCEGRGFYE